MVAAPLATLVPPLLPVPPVVCGYTDEDNEVLNRFYSKWFAKFHGPEQALERMLVEGGVLPKLETVDAR